MNPKDAARLLRSFRIEYGDFKATGPPAMLVAFSGLVLAIGATRFALAAAPAVPEVLRELRTILEIREAGKERRSLRE